MEFQLASRFMMHERVEVIVRLVRTEFSACCVIKRNDEADCDFFFRNFRSRSDLAHKRNRTVAVGTYRNRRWLAAWTDDHSLEPLYKNSNALLIN